MAGRGEGQFSDVSSDFQKDIDAIAGVSAVPTILEVVCLTTGMGFAAVARVTSNRWIVCAVKDDIAFGLTPGSELEVETTICHEIRQSGEAVVIDHVAEDPEYAAHHTPLKYGFQSYISMPIVLRDGTFFGTLCAIDPKPAQLKNPKIMGMFKMFANLIASHLDAHVTLAGSEARLADQRAALETIEASLSDERNTAVMREQFIAVLGHDLRNPLAAIDGGIRLLSKEKLSDRGVTIAKMMHASVLRMSDLINNVVDFARGRLGGGLVLNRGEEDLNPVLKQVVDELRTAWPVRRIETHIVVDRPVYCDPVRIAQLFSNLIGNALTHGASEGAIRVNAGTQNGIFELSVTNTGKEIPAAVLPRLFMPFTRGETMSQGLGLGLFIASEIAKAHGGELDAASSAAETRFTFRMPTA